MRMSIVQSFNHPLHMVNYYRAIVKDALRAYEPKCAEPIIVPELIQDLDYYFIFETSPKQHLNKLVYAITCFDSEGTILFNWCGVYPVSLWRFRRQGVSRSITIFEGLVKQVFNRKNVPLVATEPFAPFSDGVYVCNISWSIYQSLSNNRHAV